ncbi:MAG: alpha/beta fold hydrolase [Deltaproteobacteria bacterium]|nr:alpha/beta fold hydrolase [Deltaproteobacteria bacterium]
MSNQVIINTCDGYNISAEHTISNKKKVVLWLHGITVDKNEYLDFFKDGAEFIAKKGIDSLRIDFRGHGDSSGKSNDFSIIGQIIDAKSAIEFIKINYEADVEIYILGCSFGAPPALYTSIEYPEIKKIFLISPVLSYQRTFLSPETEWARELFNSETISQLDKTGLLLFNENFPIGIRLVEEMKVIRPEADIHLINQKIIIVHGEADSMVPFGVSKEVSSKFQNIHLVPIKGMDHGFMDELDEEGTGITSQNNKKFIYELIVENCL